MPMINIENVKKARQWVAEEPHFDMRTYGMLVPEEHLEYATSQLGKQPMYIEASQFTELMKSGDPVPKDCGTVQCLAGTIALRARESGELVKDVQTYAAGFLGIDEHESDTLFTSALYYDDSLEFLGDVTKEHVLARLDEIIEAGCFVWPEHYTFD